ncbi:helix-turn-helix domain-containing protein [Lysinibacillus sp. KU-BSD001]|uniref:helix-turn-helix domain-containing protein n=1 Tax=Lysinibacillus sp. KU-BSD001 TaxID=3141328 RepID=UPI0036F06C39
MSFHLLHETEIRLASYLISITHDEYGVFQTRFIPKNELKDIAEFIGTTVRHQNRVIGSFVQEGILTRVPGGIEIIKQQALNEKATEHPYEMQ